MTALTSLLWEAYMYLVGRDVGVQYIDAVMDWRDCMYNTICEHGYEIWGQPPWDQTLALRESAIGVLHVYIESVQEMCLTDDSVQGEIFACFPRYNFVAHSVMLSAVTLLL